MNSEIQKISYIDKKIDSRGTIIFQDKINTINPILTTDKIQKEIKSGNYFKDVPVL